MSVQTQMNFEVQAANLARCVGAQGRAVLAFCKQRVGGTFHAAELADFVREQCPTSPGSSDRVLRECRKRGLVSYKLVSRPKSLYEILSVSGLLPG